MNGLGPAWGPAHSITQRLTSTSASPEASSGRPTGTREVRERVGFCRSPGGRAGRWPRPRETARERRSGRPRRAVLDQSSPLDGVGHKNLDRTRDQVFPRVRSTCSASAVTVGDPDCPPGETPVFSTLSGGTGAHVPSPDGWNASPHHGGDRRAIRMGRQFPGWVQYRETPAGREVFQARPRVPGRPKPASKETRWSRSRSE